MRYRDHPSVPPDFSWSEYLRLNPSLAKKGYTSEPLAYRHWVKIGCKAGLRYKESQELPLPPPPPPREAPREEDLKIGVVIATYMRDDGKTPQLLKRALDSVFRQTFQNFKVFLIGDYYENSEEFQSICSSYDSSKLWSINLPFAFERDRYDRHDTQMLVWNYAGAFANNYGIDQAMLQGYEYVCHLDHDDFWEKDHLSQVQACILSTGALWVCTKSTYPFPKGQAMPNVGGDEFYIEYPPQARKVVHSSVCMNYRKIPLRHRNVYEETGKVDLPGDADYWERVGKWMKRNKEKGYLINKVTCRKEEEGFERTRFKRRI
jgi:glycosyltransferase involved in cell wall biosynthesis